MTSIFKDEVKADDFFNELLKHQGEDLDMDNKSNFLLYIVTKQKQYRQEGTKYMHELNELNKRAELLRKSIEASFDRIKDLDAELIDAGLGEFVMIKKGE